MCDAIYPSDLAQKYAAVCKERDELRRRLEMPDINIYDEEEIHHNCTVQILRNSVTGAVSVGWLEEDTE